MVGIGKPIGSLQCRCVVAGFALFFQCQSLVVLFFEAIGRLAARFIESGFTLVVLRAGGIDQVLEILVDVTQFL